MKIKNIGEFELIEKIKELCEPKGHSSEVVLPNGDDCFAFKNKKNILITTDTLVENVHFIKDIFPAYKLGIKSAASNLSDIAACGGVPKYALVSLVLPPELEIDWILEFYKGLNHLLSRYTTYVGGGNISKGKEISITLTLIGETEKPISRKGAKPGNIIFVTGTLGDSRLGLEILLTKKEVKDLTQIERYLVTRHLEPTPRIEIGLAIRKVATSCIDVSDGLLQDLGHILESSGVGAEIELENIPISSEYINYLKIETQDPKNLEFALTGGEDYELIFTTPQEEEKKVNEIAKKLGTRITKIGTITQEKGIRVKFKNKTFDTEELTTRMGWKHF